MKTFVVNLMTIVFLLPAVVLMGCTPSDTSEQHQVHVSQQESTAVQEYYTCPMHPSVRSDRPGACPVCGMALVKKSTLAQDHAQDAEQLKALSLSPTQRVIANVSVVPAVRQDFSKDISAVGIISYAEPNYRRITARFPARLERLYLSYTGQSVREGDPVAEVYSPEANIAQQEFLLALESYEQATASHQSFAGSAHQLLEQSRQKLLQWGLTEKQIARLEQTRKVTSTVTIYSPVSGTVVKKSVDPQQYVGIGQDMFDVADLSTVWVYLDVYEKDIRFVTPGQSVRMTVEAYPFDTFEGKVIFIDPVINPETRTVRVRSEFKNPARKLKPNMYVTATILVPTMKALVVPSSAVLSTGKRDVVWVEVAENMFEPRDVVVGAARNGMTAILNGLEEGERVVASGGFLLDSESALQQPGASSAHEEHGGRPTDATSNVHKSAASPEPALQERTITVRGGYMPAVVRVKRGSLVRLYFKREEQSPCSDELVIEKLNIRRKLPAHATTTIEFTPHEVGEISYTCGMAMLHGKIIVE